MHKGSCLCGAVTFETKQDPEYISNCHCNMCQKHHGAAYASHAVLRSEDFSYTSGAEEVSSYNSSGTVIRTFCRHCGSSIEWKDPQNYPQWLSIAVALFDTTFKAETPKEFHTEHKAWWMQNH